MSYSEKQIMNKLDVHGDVELIKSDRRLRLYEGIGAYKITLDGSTITEGNFSEMTSAFVRFANTDLSQEEINKVFDVHPRTFDDHYSYLDAMVVPFFGMVLGKIDASNAGMVVAHGDKAYSAKARWNKLGIKFQHGVLLYLLTYTEVLDRPKSEWFDWVVDNYSKYLPVIQQIEKQERVTAYQ